jgi:hypothetical protein
VVPGSHLWDDGRGAHEDEITYAEMKAGSVILYTGSVIHSGGANVSDRQTGVGINITYSLGWLRQEENQYLSCPPDIAASLPDPTCSRLIGYSIRCGPPPCGALRPGRRPGAACADCACTCRPAGPLRDAGGAVHLDRLVDDLADALGHHGLDHVHPDAGFAVAQHVHRLGGLQHHQAHGLDLDAGARDDLHVAAQVEELLAEASRDSRA